MLLYKIFLRALPCAATSHYATDLCSAWAAGRARTNIVLAYVQQQKQDADKNKLPTLLV